MLHSQILRVVAIFDSSLHIASSIWNFLGINIGKRTDTLKNEWANLTIYFSYEYNYHNVKKIILEYISFKNIYITKIVIRIYLIDNCYLLGTIKKLLFSIPMKLFRMN